MYYANHTDLRIELVLLSFVLYEQKTLIANSNLFLGFSYTVQQKKTF
jgi:hypothetical protein